MDDCDDFMENFQEGDQEFLDFKEKVNNSDHMSIDRSLSRPSSKCDNSMRMDCLSPEIGDKSSEEFEIKPAL